MVRDQTKQELGVDGAPDALVGETEVEGDVAGVLLVAPVEVVRDAPAMCGRPPRTLAGPDARAVAHHLGARVAVDLEQMAPGGLRGGDGRGGDAVGRHCGAYVWNVHDEYISHDAKHVSYLNKLLWL